MTRFPSCCKTTCSSPARFTITPAGATKTRRTSNAARPAVWPARTIYRALPGKIQYPHRTRRHERIRRPEAAPVHRPRAAQKPERFHSGRFHQRRRYRDGCEDSRPRTHIPARPRSSLRRHFPPFRMRIACSCWTTARSMRSMLLENLLKTNAIHQEVYNSQPEAAAVTFDEAAMKRRRLSMMGRNRNAGSPARRTPARRLSASWPRSWAAISCTASQSCSA